MKTYHYRRLLIALCSVLLLVSCSNSGGGIGGTGIISRGTVSAHGSIFVNGTEFDTSNAVIIVNGKNVGTGDTVVLKHLDIGKVVLVEGTGDMDGIIAVANRVTYYDNVAGPVESIVDIDPTTKKIVVLGQRVILNFLTKIKGDVFSFATIAQNDLVAISGLVDDTDAIRATFLEKTGEFDPDNSNIAGVTGFIVNLDADLKTFEINDLIVSYFSYTGVLPEGFEEGFWVEVEGTLDVVGGEMTAMSIEPGDEIDKADADQIEVFGFVTDVISAARFIVGNQVVELEANAEFVDGDAADIVTGAKLEAEGYLEDGVLYADEVEFWGPDQVEVEGVVTVVEPDSDPVEFNVRNRQDTDYWVQTDNETIFEDVNPMDIVIGMPIEIKGIPIDIDHSVIVADKVSFEED